MSYVDKIKNGNDTIDIQDARIPTGVASKFLGTDSNGEYTLLDAPQGGASLQSEEFTTSNGWTDVYNKINAVRNAGHVPMYMKLCLNTQGGSWSPTGYKLSSDSSGTMTYGSATTKFPSYSTLIYVPIINTAYQWINVRRSDTECDTIQLNISTQRIYRKYEVMDSSGYSIEEMYYSYNIGAGPNWKSIIYYI